MRPDSGPNASRPVGIAAVAEAARRGDRRVGTDHLLLGLLAVPDGVAARALMRDLDAARHALDTLDGAALAAVGVRVEATDGELWGGCVASRTPALSSGARAVLLRAAGLRQRTDPLAAEHILLALLETELPDPAAQLIDALGVDREQARRHVGEAPKREAI